MDVHPSGKVMITSGKEKKLTFWNLLKFIRVLDIRLDYEVRKTLFYKDDVVIVADNSINLLDTTNNKTIQKAQCKSKIQDSLVYKNFIITSHEHSEITLWSATAYTK